MLKLFLSDNAEIYVREMSTLFDIQVDPEQYSVMLAALTENDLKLVKLVSDGGDLLDQMENLVFDRESSITNKNENSVVCHFYLREKTENELLKERIAFLEEQLIVHDGAIADMGETISELAEEGGLA